MSVNVAMVGLGYWGPNLARSLSVAVGGSLHTLCDARADQLTRFGAQYPSAKTTKDYSAVLADPAIHAVVLATPVHTHHELAAAALRAGKHVLAEKPLTQTSKQCEELIVLAKERRLVLMSGHVFLYNPAVRQVKAYIDAGEVGDVLHIYSERLNLGIVRQDVNALWNVAPHDISIINHWLGTTATTARAHGYSYLQPGIEDVAFATLDYPGRVSAHMHVSWIDPTKSRRMTVVGTKKMIVYDDMSIDARVTLMDRAALRGEDGKVTLRNGDSHIPKLDSTEPLRLECQHFVDCIRDGKTPLSDGHEALLVIRTLEALTRSMAQGGVAVPLGPA